MSRSNKSAEWSVALFLLAALALSPPILSIFSVEGTLFGLPVLYLYFFTVWAVIVAAVAWTADLGAGRQPPDDPGAGASERPRRWMRPRIGRGAER
ncbi:MAG: hypothetical protein D6826_11145 [Alphaproteobacteria bacterium]|nr:MAG: hypothetical protein D6826_11145 [Alphaproteobacteria bacterium]